MPGIKLHDTPSGMLKALERPAVRPRLRIYACGPTVYSRIHVGNARPFVIFMLLARFLRHEGYGVELAINITDVNDKIYDAARKLGVPSGRLAEQMAQDYLADTNALGLGRPEREPKASKTIEPIVDYIKALIDDDRAYAVEGDVYFRVRSDEEYGTLSHRTVDDMDQGEGLEGAERKDDPLDFALWKGRKGDEDTFWPAPWGEGRPGWHIECSAMAEGEHGEGVDIHGGGIDLLFPHHENEASQTRARRRSELAHIWMHNGMIQFTGEKMAKSVGNIALLHQVIEAFGAEAVVMYLISGHYRQPLAFSDSALAQAQANVERIREAGRRLASGETSPDDLTRLRERFFDALRRDFNTAEALSVLNEWLREATHGLHGDAPGDSHLREMLEVLGLESLLAPAAEAPEEVRALAEQRERARAEKDFAGADELRERIAALGWEVRDSAQGFALLPL
ncbi:MAG: cysteine--tRNA ligase [Solirubrobacteraceae bacterium]